MNENLLRLIYSHKKCGLSDSQILTIFLGMGIIQEVAEKHIKYYNEITKGGGNPMDLPDLALNTGFQVQNANNINITNEKNNMRNFNLIQLYENLMQTAKELHELATVKTNASYSAVSAFSVIESALTQFPGEINLLIGRKNAGLPVDENKINPGLKYYIAESVYNMLHESFLTPAKTLCAYISATMEEDKWGYVGSKMMTECGKKSNNAMYAKLFEQIQTALLSDNIKESLSKVATESEFWCSESKQLISLMETEHFETKKELSKSVVNNNNYKMITCFSPVISDKSGVTFNLYGKNYTINSGKLYESKVKDERYNNVVNGLSLMTYNPKDLTLEYYGINGKVLEYNLNENKINVGTNDLTNLASIDLKDYFNISGLFNKETSRNINTLVKMFESRDMITKLDNCVNLQSDINAALFLTLISVEEGYYINSVDYINRINEMKFFKSATSAKNYIKEMFNYDATNILIEDLKIEGNNYAAILEKRTSIQERIDFLKTKRGEIVSRIESLPENANNKLLTDALNIIDGEIKTNELELGNTYTIDSCGNNCVPVRVCNLVGTLVPGDVVYIDAAEFTNAPDYTTLTVTDPKTGSSVVVNKNDLIFDINHDDVTAAQITDPVVAGCPNCNNKCCSDGSNCKNGECEICNEIPVLISDDNDENE